MSKYNADQKIKLNKERMRIHRIVNLLGLPPTDYFLNGSGALALFGVARDRPMGDLDVFMTTALWFDLLHNKEFLPCSSTWEIVLPDRSNPRRRCDPPILRGVVENLTVDLFLNWRRRNGPGDFDPAFYLNNVEFPYADIPCAPLQFIMDWKIGQGRNKDLLDVVSIRDFLEIDGNIAD